MSLYNFLQVFKFFPGWGSENIHLLVVALSQSEQERKRYVALNP